MEISLEDLTVRQFDLPSAFLGVPHQHSLVVLPVILKQFEVGEVKGLEERHWIIVVDLSEAVELVLCPAALIGQFPALVIEFPLAVHLVVPPLALIISSVLVVELPSAVAHAVALKAFVPTASLVLLHHVFLLECLHGLFGVEGRVLVADFDDGGVVFVLGGGAIGGVVLMLRDYLVVVFAFLGDLLELFFCGGV